MIHAGFDLILLYMHLYGIPVETYKPVLKISFSNYNIHLRRIFGPNRNENDELRRLHNEELHSLNGSPNIFRVIKSGKMRWAGHVARMGEDRNAFKILISTLQDRDV